MARYKWRAHLPDLRRPRNLGLPPVQWLRQHPEFLQFLPDTTKRQRLWLLLVSWAFHKVDADFGVWTARHVPELPGRSDQEVGSFASDIADWASAGKPPPTRPGYRAPPPAGREFVVRPFAPSMSLKTVTALSAEWHEAVAAAMDGPDATFPPPWYPAAKVGDFDFLPIEKSGELYREGAAMHHCIGTYVDAVQSGGCYVYSVRQADKRIATFALARCAVSAELSEIRGPCNAQVPEKTVAAVRRWLRAQPPLPLRSNGLLVDSCTVANPAPYHGSDPPATVLQRRLTTNGGTVADDADANVARPSDEPGNTSAGWMRRL
jgi:PcfJ-like protein